MLSAVVVGRLLTPTDAAPTGETLWLAQASLLGFVLWTISAYRAERVLLRFNWVDVAVGLFYLGHIIGAVVVVSTSGDKRAAMTMLWEWMGIAVTWFLIRQLGSSSERSGLVLVVAASAVSLSGLGIWQHHVGYAESRRTYEKLKSENAALTQSGRPHDPRAGVEWDRNMQKVRADFVSMNIPVDDSSRILWEQRLYSGEPIGMFALANTLAGVLVCASILWLGVLVRAGRAGPAWLLVLGGLSTALILYCLLLTKSRTAFVGLASGLGLWCAAAFGSRGAGVRRLWQACAALTAVVLVLVVVATSTGGLDRLVISESTKSLRYRFEYWTATWRMLAVSPRNWLLGVGPGNFRDNYLQFKLPESSEEIADPHNLVLDVWANGGLAALSGLVGLCLAGLRPLWSASHTESDSQKIALDFDPTWADGILAGGILGHLMILFLGLGSEETLSALLAGWILVVFVCRPLFRNEPSTVAYGSAFAALVVHLLGAGGIGMPAISQVLLLVVVLGAPDQQLSGWRWEPNSRTLRATLGATSLALFVGCWFTGLKPVLEVSSNTASATEALFETGSLSKAEREFRRAAEADPWSPIPCERLSELAFQQWLASGRERPDEFQQSVEWQERAIDRNPRHAGNYRMLAEMYVAHFKRSRSKADAAAAVNAMHQAVALYPNHALTQSLLAEALQLDGLQDEARQAAGRALELDEINERAGHIDKRLPKERLKLMMEVVESTDRPSS
jgi:hypothetical protein